MGFNFWQSIPQQERTIKMNEVFIPYSFRTRRGARITNERYTEGKSLWESTKEFCKNNVKNKYVVDNTVYGKGVRVELEDEADVEVIHAWINKNS